MSVRKLVFGLAIAMFISLSVTSPATIAMSGKTSADSLSPALSLPDCIPNEQNCSHRTGSLSVTLTNYGLVGSLAAGVRLRENYCLTTGENAPGFVFPAGSNVDFLYAAGLWIGGIVRGDTLLFSGFMENQAATEFYPDTVPNGGIVYDADSTGTADPREYNLRSSFIDAFNPLECRRWDPSDGQYSNYLKVSVTQESHSWSVAGYDKAVVIDYEITNFGIDTIRQMCVGIFVDGDVFHRSVRNGHTDDITGYAELNNRNLRHGSIKYGWIADNDGDPRDGKWDSASARGVLAVGFVGDLPSSCNVSYNWWVSPGDPAGGWGPREDEPNLRDIGNQGLGAPVGDRNAYYVMAKPEIDYDNIETAVNHTSQGWLPPPSGAARTAIADGADVRFLISFGGFDLAPSQKGAFALVLAAGADFHSNPSDFADYFDPFSPGQFYNKLDFSDLERSLVNAALLYEHNYTLPSRGDMNWDGSIDVLDVVDLIYYVFAGGAEPDYYSASRINCDSRVDIRDIVHLIRYIYQSGSPPGLGCN